MMAVMVMLYTTVFSTRMQYCVGVTLWCSMQFLFRMAFSFCSYVESTGLRPPRHRALTAISILDMAFAVEPVVWATSQNLNDHAWCNVHASPLDQAGVGPRTASVYIYDGVKKSENGGTIFVAKSLVLKDID